MTGFVPPGPGQPPEEPPGSPPQQPPQQPWPPQYHGHAAYGGPSPDGDVSRDLIRAGRSKKMAGWALGLSFVWCLHPFTLLPSVGLAIAALARSGEGREPREHGRGMAIAALVINGLWVVLIVVLIVTGGLQSFLDDADRDEEGQVTEPTDIPILSLRVGDCANDPNLVSLGPEETAETYELEAVPCRLPHDLEAFHDYELPDGDYPGEDAIFREAEQRCVQAARKFLGGPKGARRLGITSYVPRETSWRLYDDRKVLCVITERGRKTVGTLEGTGRR
jgi:hypothetical protein